MRFPKPTGRQCVTKLCSVVSTLILAIVRRHFAIFAAKKMKIVCRASGRPLRLLIALDDCWTPPNGELVFVKRALVILRHEKRTFDHSEPIIDREREPPPNDPSCLQAVQVAVVFAMSQKHLANNDSDIRKCNHQHLPPTNIFEIHSTNFVDKK
jgi:hypothetical protein